ncbi:DNA cytosine methyltransferase [Fibrella aquatilis]|uniref:DNA (cytosine-5-)-methyltransferase n=1 Tax=Fibrella aquatilis TaxID=2817059 RepID=A0A939GBG6_9BACT|nr:DNA cytosine methyltransferase [Fibrella aquatilis]MBO0934738.1 DNA cytosine methyltransferase [Fibrella aquatilis]
MLTAVSLFSNCGAGDVGYRRADFQFEVMAELEPNRLDVCERNHPGTKGVPGDLRTTWQQVVADWHQRQEGNRPDLLCACPPCQGMSSARAGLGAGSDPKKWEVDERNLLVEVVANVVRSLQPRLVVLENVPQFLTRLVKHPDTDDGISAPNLLLERIGVDYAAFPVVVDMADYGVPQTRKRTFITLVRRDEPCLVLLNQSRKIPFPIPTHEGDKRISFGQFFTQYNLSPLNPLRAEEAVDAQDPLHAVPVWDNGVDDRRYAMVQATALNGGSAWDNKACSIGCNNENESINDEMAVCPQCGNPLLRPVVKDKKTGDWRLIQGFRNSSYRRLDERLVASTVTTASAHLGSDINIHPTQNRLLSVRECALLQTFPWDFDWGKTLERGHLNKIREMIGEAVPPLFTQAHGLVLNNLLEGTADLDSLMDINNTRSRRARIKLGLPPQPVQDQPTLF